MDGTVIGTVADGEKKSFNVTTGKHVLRLKIDWASSNRLEFEAVTDKTLQFKCASRARGARFILAVIYAAILSQRYIKLEAVN